ncbi:MAG: hypothetical protein KKA55_08790 [Proteobacteria bacterium]|nr:hypothetical protein [Pseudomonadota bacterium]MBU1595612.1 hypothetical protein [Pseudomonadota bacterium]
MKRLACLALLLTLACPLAGLAADLQVSFADPAWNGEKIPAGQICKKFGGSGSTPPITVENIPPEADAIVLSFCDRSYSPMNHGGHGVIAYRIAPGSAKVVVPAFPGETFDVPEGFLMLRKHQGWSTPGAYLPPCSGGNGNRYDVEVSAAKLESEDGKSRKELVTKKLTLGYY